MKAFKLIITSEQEIIAANNPVEALKYYSDLTSMSLDEIAEETEDFIEIDKSEWENIILTNTEYDESNPNDMPKSWTLLELMNETKSPELLSSTVY